jgi:uncharacterized protein (DUF779 family)
MMPKKPVLFLLLGLTLFVAVLYATAGTRVPETSAQVTSQLSLRVESARTEPDAVGGPVLEGDAVVEYKYLINIDNTGDPIQPRSPGCDSTNPNYPDSCDWPSIREVPGAAPILTQGDQTDFDRGGTLDLPDGKYLVSVLADGYKVGGAHFTVPLPANDANGANVTVKVHPNPLPTATLRIKVFEDISPVNGQFDAPAEQGLEGFHVVINDTAGELSADVFGNPLCSTYDANGDVTGQTECLKSDANGDIVVPNLGPLRYDIVVVPPDGTDWVETTTLEGSPSWDTWLQEGGTGLDNEFVVAGEPFPWTIFGFVRPTDELVDRGVTGGVKGTLVKASIYLPQQGALPYYGDMWNGFNGSRVTDTVGNGWVALSDLQGGDTAVYISKANADGTYQIDNVPDGNYLFTWWDETLHYRLDWMQVTVTNGEMYDMGTPFLTGWFTPISGYVFNDLNQNGKRDPGEPGVANYLVVIRDRDNSEIDRMSIAATTDANGFYELEKGYPMNSWMVLEAYNDRFYTTGITYQVENQVDPNTGQPQKTTIVGDGVDVGFLPVLGQGATVDWGVHAYDGTVKENGGIVGSVFYDTTRAEYDPQYQGAEAWAPGIPHLPMNLYAPVPCGSTGAACDAAGAYELDADGAYAKGELLNTTTTEVWEQPTGCTARDANGAALPWGTPNQEVLPTSDGATQDTSDTKRCIEAPLMGTQIQSGFATLDGNWGFVDGCFGPGGATAEGICADGSEPTSLPAGDYLVEVAIPTEGDVYGADAVHPTRPLYQVVREEDLNVFNGDQYTPAVPPSACAGALHTVDVAGIGADGANAVINPTFAENGGSPFEGQDRPLCDVKFVTLNTGKSIAPIFTLFTDVPIPGKWKGYIIDDLNIATDPQHLDFGEKMGIGNMPIGVYDYTNRLLTTITSDPNGTYEILLPSTHTVNCPSPSGVCASMYYILGNDPGQPGQLNPNYNPQYRTIGATFEIYPGLMVPSDLAPTQIVPGVLAAGSLFGTPPQCTINDPLNPTTPEIFAVSQPYVNGSGAITIDGQGFGTGGYVTLNGREVPVTAWSATQITIDIPAGTPEGPYQMEITSDNGNRSVNGLTMHVLGGSYTPTLYEVGNGYPYAVIQDAITAAESAGGDALVIVYPGTPAQWNPNGVYYENLVINSPIKLQGIGPGGVYQDGSFVLGSNIDGRGVAGDTGYADIWRDVVLNLTWDGNQAIFEGPVMYVLARDGEFTDGFKAAIDGFTIQGGDQQGFPNNLTPADPTQQEFAAVQGGGIFANGYARYLQITNNVMQSNGGAYAGAIRLGTPHIQGPLNDSQNDFVTIANNRILANGGTNLAGAIGIFSGAEGYEVANNDVCGNFSAEYGGGISHYGYSPGGSIHDNRVYFNRSFDEGGGIMIAGELPADPTTLSPGAGDVDVYNNLIQANLGNDDGGGLRFLMAGDFTYNVFNNIIVNNVSTHEGGGVSMNDAPNVRFFNNTVMKNITTATAATSTGSPMPAGLSTSQNSALLQATLPVGAPTFSDPLMFNNIFWDNRAGAFTGNTVAGIGIPGDPSTILNWDMGVSDGTGLLSPTNTMLQVTTGTNFDTSNIVGTDPLVVSTYDTSVTVLPWRGNPRFVDILMVTATATPNLLGDYHLQGTSAAIDLGAASKDGIDAPSFDIDGGGRPGGAIDSGADEVSTIQFYFSITGPDQLAGSPLAGGTDGSIYAYEGGTSYRVVMDEAAFGLGDINIDALHVVDEDTFYISFADDGTSIAALGSVQDEDVVLYDAGAWSWFFDGSDVGIGDAGDSEDVDAFMLLPDGDILISTRGTFTVGSGFWAANQDLARCTPTSTGATTACTWSDYFIGDEVGMSDAEENVDGTAVFGNNVHLTTTGSFVVPGLSGWDGDIITCQGLVSTPSTSCSGFTMLFDTATGGVEVDLDALSLP